nr:MAG TPA: hypothetical protein [Caudoviricetes sp.]
MSSLFFILTLYSVCVTMSILCFRLFFNSFACLKKI